MVSVLVVGLVVAGRWDRGCLYHDAQRDTRQQSEAVPIRDVTVPCTEEHEKSKEEPKEYTRKEVLRGTWRRAHERVIKVLGMGARN